jgi:hypothetical protein
MSRLTDVCPHCLGPKLNLTANYCEDCMAAVAGAEAAAQAAGDDPVIARRRALEARAHKAHRNFPDPRAFDRKTIWMTGNIPQAERPRP